MRVGSACFAEHAVPDLEQRDGHWLGQQGRLTTPVVKRPGDTHYRPVSWNEAIRVVAAGLKAPDSPDEAAFYTSGRTSNNAAFLYQLLARRFATHHLPARPNMCQETRHIAPPDTTGKSTSTSSRD